MEPGGKRTSNGDKVQGNRLMDCRWMLFFELLRFVYELNLRCCMFSQSHTVKWLEPLRNWPCHFRPPLNLSNFSHFPSLIAREPWRNRPSHYWLFPLTRRSFLFWCSPSFYLCFCFACSFEVISKKALPRPMSGSSSSLFSSRSFKFSGLRFNFLIHFELNCCVEEKLLASQSWVRSYDTVSETDSVLDPGKQ